MLVTCNYIFLHYRIIAAWKIDLPQKPSTLDNSPTFCKKL